MRTTSRYRATARMIAAIGVVSLAAACSGNGGAVGGGDAASYPDDNITIVVPFSAGGPTDTVTRMIAEPMAAKLGGKIVVQNVEGAGGTVGAGEVARAKPDGYTRAHAPHRHVDRARPVQEAWATGLWRTSRRSGWSPRCR